MHYTIPVYSFSPTTLWLLETNLPNSQSCTEPSHSSYLCVTIFDGWGFEPHTKVLFYPPERSTVDFLIYSQTITNKMSTVASPSNFMRFRMIDQPDGLAPPLTESVLVGERRTQYLKLSDNGSSTYEKHTWLHEESACNQLGYRDSNPEYKNIDKWAGVVGIEPTNVGVKVRCVNLFTIPHYYIIYHS